MASLRPSVSVFDDVGAYRPTTLLHRKSVRTPGISLPSVQPLASRTPAGSRRPEKDIDLDLDGATSGRSKPLRTRSDNRLPPIYLTPRLPLTSREVNKTTSRSFSSPFKTSSRSRPGAGGSLFLSSGRPRSDSASGSSTPPSPQRRRHIGPSVIQRAAAILERLETENVIDSVSGVEDDDDRKLHSYSQPQLPSSFNGSELLRGAFNGVAAPDQGIEIYGVGRAAGLDQLDDDEREIVEEALDDFAFVRKVLPRAFLSHEETRTEFRCLDYSPLCNSRPVDLAETLRVVRAGRKIRISISITCYNESSDQLKQTLHGIAQDLPKLESAAGLHWSEVLVTVIMDGTDALSETMLDYLQHDRPKAV
jgi:Chitin synthase